MKVVFLQNVRRHGVFGDVSEVKKGFAKNFLIPRGMALSATKRNIKTFEHKKDEIQKQNESLKQEALDVCNSLTDCCITFIKRASDDGKLYGSISTSDIAHKINEYLESNSIDCKKIVKNDILLKNTIREIGLHSADVTLFHNVSAVIEIGVGISESEVSELLLRNKDNSSDEENDTNDIID